MNSPLTHQAARAQHDERLARRLEAAGQPRISSPTRKVGHEGSR